jgi:hypothetical protein
MRLIKIGPTDLRVAQVIDGTTEGDKVVQLGAIIMSKPPVPPTLEIAANMKRGAPSGSAPGATPSPATTTASTSGTAAGSTKVAGANGANPAVPSGRAAKP